MNTKVYKQTDSRWAKLAYPKKPCTIGGSGCGEVAMCNAMIEAPKYKTYTPKTIYGYMRKYGSIVNGTCDGTKRDGITEAFKHYGFTNVVRLKEQPMSKLWTQLKKGNRVGILLMNSNGGGSKCITWTTSGHYIAYVGYKKKGSKHYLYCKDSGGRGHDGWYCYEDHMRGAVKDAWCAVLPKSEDKEESTPTPTPSTKTKYTGAFPNTEVKETTDYAGDINKTALKFAFPYGTAKSKYTYPKAKPDADCFAAIPKVWDDTSKWSKQMRYGADCAVYVGAVLGTVGIGVFSRYAKAQIKQYASSKKLKAISGTDARKVPAGTIGCWTKSSGQHVFIVVEKSGQKYIAEGSHPSKYYGRLSKKAPKYGASAYKTFQFYVPVEETKVIRNYLQEGDSGSEVTKWQKFLNWYFGSSVVAEDGDFGSYTDKYTRKFQANQGITSDGKVGTQTISKAKAVEK